MYLINGIPPHHGLRRDTRRIRVLEHGKITAAYRMDELQLPEQAEVLDDRLPYLPRSGGRP